ncbi:hypothetical protein [Falsiphaeobacter marinintestinus]|uniref:hypothetical protein n=1 Tax=Falsiphaeobacter marinintestinus TaxID=1492905 RepID=UPI0011B6E1DD|nr:hypothetical protein [Phaeobacter marinintestinus]
MNQKPLIALEIHDVSIAEPSRVLPVVETMEQWGYNALVLHQNDLLDSCTQLGLTANYGVSDLRLKKVRNTAAWLNTLVDRLDRFDARLFLEIKEPSFQDYALELYPDLLGSDGAPDPTLPRWVEFCRRKTADLLARVPGIGGFIINLSSPESRVSLPDHLAQSAVGFDGERWFDDMIEAFHGPLAAADKDLYVRDFSYTTDMQSGVLAAVDRCAGQVGASVKITAHDYFPEFPENPVARTVQAPVILEFEAFGEHTGWGVIPNCRVEEFCRRMVGYREIGASGFLMRTSWEAITGANALDSLSAVNVFVLPKLVETDVDARVLISGWLKDGFGVDGNVADQAVDLLLQSWHIPAAAYWNSKVFPRHSCLPSTWQEGWLSMASSGMGRRDRDLAILPDDPELSEAARVSLFAAKDAVVVLADQLASDARTLSAQLPNDLAQLFKTFAWVPVFARQFELATKATFFAARGAASDLEQLGRLRDDLMSLADDLERQLGAAGDLPHHHMVLFDPEQIRRFVQSLPVVSHT